MTRAAVLFHLPFLPPRQPACEAISQEVEALRGRFGGEVIYVNPNQHLPFPLPRLCFGLHRLYRLRRNEAEIALHHFYNPDPFPFPYLRLLRRPVIYSLTGGVDSLPHHAFFGKMAAITVMDRGSYARLRRQGVERLFLVRPGIRVERFTPHPLPWGEEIRLMVGSAPWTKAQFRSKGVLALLEAVKLDRRLRLVFLWRGILAEELWRWIRFFGVEERITVWDKRVDVNEVLSGVHASVVLASTPALVKAYPHSLLESLAAGKPVLVSRAIPMAQEVEERRCGEVVEQISAEALLAALAALGRHYPARCKAALAAGREFSIERMVASFEEVYRYAGYPL